MARHLAPNHLGTQVPTHHLPVQATAADLPAPGGAPTTMPIPLTELAAPTELTAPRRSRPRPANPYRPATPYRPGPVGAASPAARPIDLLSMRLVLQQHLDELRLRGAGDDQLRPIADELRLYAESIDDLARSVGLPVPGRRSRHAV